MGGGGGGGGLRGGSVDFWGKKRGAEDLRGDRLIFRRTKGGSVVT